MKEKVWETYIQLHSYLPQEPTKLDSGWDIAAATVIGINISGDDSTAKLMKHLHEYARKIQNQDCCIKFTEKDVDNICQSFMMAEPKSFSEFGEKKESVIKTIIKDAITIATYHGDGKHTVTSRTLFSNIKNYTPQKSLISLDFIETIDKFEEVKHIW